MSSGPKTVTSTTNTQPPAYLVPSLAAAAGSATRDFRNMDSNIVNAGGLPSDTMQARGLADLYNRGAEGSPLVNSAGDLTQRTLQGDFLSPDSNPYLAQTFNRAADLTRTRLDTEFGGAGRNLGAARPARSDELQTLAANIYGPNYRAERGIQAGAVGQAQDLAGEDFRDIQAQIDAGAFSLDQFINRLAGIIPGAGGVTQSQQPFFRTGLF